MSETHSPSVECPVVVFRVPIAQVMGDMIADALRDQFLTRYEQSGAVHVIVDMHEVKYLSSSGLRPFLSLNKKVREREGRLILARLLADVESVFVATRLISSHRAAPTTFEHYADVPSAVAALYASS